MAVFDTAAFDDHEHVSFFADPPTGLRAIIAIHRTGPAGTAGGGCRMWPYRDERAAIRDVLRLSRAMTYKLALVELPAGGAKAVIIGDPARDKSDALLAALGKAVERLGGRFVISEDVGVTSRDLTVIAGHTAFVSRQDGSGPDGAVATAEGVVQGMKVAVRRRLGRADLAGLTVAVQGLGRVGRSLCRRLAAEGASLIVSSLDPRDVDAVAHELGAARVAPDAIFDQPADVFAPCALADAIDDRSAPRLKCAVVAGSANDQLAAPRLAEALARRGILYAPDFVINAGGVLAAAFGGDGRLLSRKLESIGVLLEAIFDRAERERISTQLAAERTARERMSANGGRP
jgi:leucine dehydrogenase